MFWRKRSAPDPAAACLAQAEALIDEARWDDAAWHIQEALRHRPGYREARLAMGEVLCQLGRPDEGMAHWHEQMHDDPADAEPHFLLGLVYLEQGQRNWAIAELRQALLRDPDHERAQAHLRKATVQNFAMSSDESASRREQHAWALSEFKQVQATARRHRGWRRIFGWLFHRS